MKLGALLSGGKDSLYAMYKMKQEGFDVACVLTMKSENPYSYMFHTPNINLVKLQAEAMSIPIIEHTTLGEKETELKDLEILIKEAIRKYRIRGITTGALYSNYQKKRIEKICKKLRLKVLSPLWHMDQEKELRMLLKEKFKFIIVAVAAYGLDKSWLGKAITEKDIDRLVELNKKYKINIGGEGGEFESLVLDCPLFSKKIDILDSEILEESRENAKLIVKKAELIQKGI